VENYTLREAESRPSALVVATDALASFSRFVGRPSAGNAEERRRVFDRFSTHIDDARSSVSISTRCHSHGIEILPEPKDSSANLKRHCSTLSSWLLPREIEEGSHARDRPRRCFRSIILRRLHRSEDEKADRADLRNEARQRSIGNRKMIMKLTRSTDKDRPTDHPESSRFLGINGTSL